MRSKVEVLASPPVEEDLEFNQNEPACRSIRWEFRWRDGIDAGHTKAALGHEKVDCYRDHSRGPKTRDIINLY